MASNPIQFQPGMSLPDFIRYFGVEAHCADALARARWPDGFACPACAATAHCVVNRGTKALYQCNACRHQTSITAGTLFASTKLPLTTWFLAIYLISQAKTGLSALALKRQLGVSYPTAWLMHHKIMRAMADSNDQERLAGPVQIDDAYLGGEINGAKAGRGSPNKVPFVAAVAVNEQGHPIHLKLSPVATFSREAISQWAKANLSPGSVVTSDGLACFAGVTDAGCIHAPFVVGQLKPRDLPQFKWVNTIVGNLKTTLSGAYHAFKFRKYAARYLGAFAYRFNHRFNLVDLVLRLLVETARAPAASQRVIRKAEDHF